MYEARQCKSVNNKFVRTIPNIQRKKMQRIIMQRATLPNDFIYHQEDMNKIIDKMVNIDGGGKDNSLSFFIGGTDNWAKETRLAAIRKYNEMETAIRRFNLRKRNVRLGEDINTEADIEEKDGSCEIKTVNGKILQLENNISKAFNQLFVNFGGRVKQSKIGTAYIYLTDYYFEVNHSDFKGVDKIEYIDNIANRFIQKDPQKNRIFKLIIVFNDEERVYSRPR